MYSTLTTSSEIQLSQIYSHDKKRLLIKIPEVQKQTNSIDCGLFAIANAVEFCFTSFSGAIHVEFNTELFREHLVICLEKGEFIPFPKKKISMKASAIGQNCTQGGPTNQCSDPKSSCKLSDGDEYRCLCNSGYYVFSDKCTAKVILEEICFDGRPPNQCNDDNAACTGTSVANEFRCQCKTGFYKNNADICTEKITINNNCLDGQPTDQCVDGDATCLSDSGSFKCLCKDGFYLNSGDKCTSKNFGDNEIKTDSSPESIVPITLAESVHQHRISVSKGENENGGTDRNKTAESQNIAQCFAGLQDILKQLINRDKTHDMNREFNLQQWYNHAGISNRSETYTSNRGNYQEHSLQGNTEMASFHLKLEIFHLEKGINIQLHKLGRLICPYKTLLEYIQVRKEFSPINQTDPLFITIDKKPLERQYFLTCIKKVLDICGFNSNHYNGHSFRIGAATSAGKAKIEDHLIKTLGHWSSDSYIRYIRVMPASIKTAQRRLEVGLNAVCTSGQSENQCVDTNATCQGTTTYRCLCKDKYYENKAGKCYIKSGLGEGCISGEPVNQCSVTNTECIESTGGNIFKCLCMAGYYSDYTCKALVDLKANNLMVPAVTTGETYFLVTWSNPTTVSFINKYQLILSFNGQQETPVEIVTSKVNHNVTSRTPGRKYRIILRSIETASRPTQQTTEIEIMDGSRPSIPGLLQGSVFTAPSISFVWKTNGDVEFFSGTINDTTASPNTFNLTAIDRIPPPLTVSKLRYGDHYTFTVVSHSNGFSSDSRTQTIRTTPTTPPPPVNLNCKEVFDRSLTITWNEPNPPNGYILHYIVYHISLNKELQTNGSVTEQLIEGLYPETWYSFQVATVNDASTGTSGRSAPKYCQTQTALASKPLNAVSTSVTTTSTTMEWDPPAEPGGQIWAYKLTVSNVTGGTETCVQEVIFQCSNCSVSVT
ncbi:unnamed protein product [Mytilus coruscus]|uniref:Fibronectin type-III domain-containing protein n=1 Tax=Mytilus coruscus TaxID=42192 RepID=A0A6J8CBY1_MYTCO|nr:unnamed protein product [Mytilus coruscus]